MDEWYIGVVHLMYMCIFASILYIQILEFFFLEKYKLLNKVLYQNCAELAVGKTKISPNIATSETYI